MVRTQTTTVRRSTRIADRRNALAAATAPSYPSINFAGVNPMDGLSELAALATLNDHDLDKYRRDLRASDRLCERYDHPMGEQFDMSDLYRTLPSLTDSPPPLSSNVLPPILPQTYQWKTKPEINPFHSCPISPPSAGAIVDEDLSESEEGAARLLLNIRERSLSSNSLSQTVATSPSFATPSLTSSPSVSFFGSPSLVSPSPTYNGANGRTQPPRRPWEDDPMQGDAPDFSSFHKAVEAHWKEVPQLTRESSEERPSTGSSSSSWSTRQSNAGLRKQKAGLANKPAPKKRSSAQPVSKLKAKSKLQPNSGSDSGDGTRRSRISPWPKDTSELFQRIIEMFPPIGRAKLDFLGMNCGRNEIIGCLISLAPSLSRGGIFYGRKRISSHSQTCKQKTGHDEAGKKQRALLVSDNKSKNNGENVVRPHALRVFPLEFADILGLPRSTNLATYDMRDHPIVYEDGWLRVETHLEEAMDIHRKKLRKASADCKQRNAK